MQQIIPGLYTFRGLVMGRAYLIADPAGLTVLDAGLPLAAPRIVRQLAAKGYKPGDVKRILITHAHPDHVGGLTALKERTGAQVIASARERPVIEGKEPAQRPTRESLSGLARWMSSPASVLPGTPVDRVVEDGESLAEVMGGLQVIATPGHSPGHLAFWQPERRVLFCGDVLMRFLRLRLPFAAFTPDMAENIRSIGRLAELDAAIVCFGHGNPLTQNAAEAIRRFARNTGAPQTVRSD